MLDAPVDIPLELRRIRLDPLRIVYRPRGYNEGPKE
jgi:hypothetical protein